MDSMSDSEADNIVVAMAAPSGPLGDAFEVDVAAGSSRPNSSSTPRPKKSARGRKNTTYATRQRKLSHFSPEKSHPLTPVAPLQSSSKSPAVATTRNKTKSNTSSPASHSSTTTGINKGRKNNTNARKSKSTSISTGCSAPAHSYPHSPSSPSHTTNSPKTMTTTKASEDDSNSNTTRRNSITKAAVFSKLSNTRLERNKNQLCELWEIDTRTLEDAFGNVSGGSSSGDEALDRISTHSVVRDFVAKLLRMAQTTGLRFCGARSELERVKAQRVRGTSSGDSKGGEAGRDSSSGGGDANDADDAAWVAEDIDRVMDMFLTEKGKSYPSSRKRTASQASVEQEQKGRPPPAERKVEELQTSPRESPNAQNDISTHNGTVAQQNTAPRPMVIVNTRIGSVDGRGQNKITPTQNLDIDKDERLERASVPRASSVEAMLEAQRNKTPAAQPPQKTELSQAMQPQSQPETAGSPVQAYISPYGPQTHSSKAETSTSGAQSSLTKAEASPPRTQTNPSQAQSKPQASFQPGTTGNPVRTQQTPSQSQTAVEATSPPPQHRPRSYSISGSVRAHSGPRIKMVAPPRPKSTPSQPRPPPSPETTRARGGQSITSQTRPSHTRPPPATLAQTTPLQSTPPLGSPMQGISLQSKLPQTSPLQVTPQLQRQGETQTGTSMRPSVDVSAAKHPLTSATAAVRSLLNATMPTQLHHTSKGLVLAGMATTNAGGNSLLSHAVEPNVVAPPKGPVATSKVTTNGPITADDRSNDTVPSGVVSNCAPSHPPVSNASITNGSGSNTPVSTVTIPNGAISNAPLSSPEPSENKMSNPPVSNSPVSSTGGSSKLQRAAVSKTPGQTMSSDSIANGAVPTRLPGGTEQRTTPAQDQGSSSEKGEAAATRTKEYAEVHTEALRRLEYCQALPPSIFDYILQTLCCISASHIALSTVTGTTGNSPQPSSYVLQCFGTIIIPFYLDNKWTLATLNPEGKEITVYGPATEHERTVKAATSLATSWLYAADDAHTWSKTYIPMSPPAVYWNQSIVCLVAAVHIFAGVAPPHQDPDTILWRSILAALIRAFAAADDSLKPAYSPLDDSDHLDKSVLAPPDALLIPPPPHNNTSNPAASAAPLTIQAYFAHLRSTLSAFHTRHAERLALARARRDAATHAHALLAQKLLAPSFLAAQRDAYAVRRADVRELAARTDALISAMRRVPTPAAAACSDALMKELCALSEGAGRILGADAPRVEGLERLMMGGGGGGSGGGRAVEVGRFVGGLAEGAEGRVGRLVEGWERVWGGVEGEWAALAGMFGKEVSGGQGDCAPDQVILG